MTSQLSWTKLGAAASPCRTRWSAAVRRFIEGLGGQVVVKPLGFSVVFEAGHGRPVYTHALTADDLADLRGVEATAHLFQRYIADKQLSRLSRTPG